MDSLDKLRAYEDVDRFESMEPWDVAHIADEIEREIAESYMELPVDRKNEPWHIGDKFSFADAGGNKHICTVSGISVSEVFFYYDEHHDSTKHRHFKADVLVHVKPDTLKELLDDVSKGIICYPRERVTGYLEDNHSIGEAVMLDVRDRLREMMGGDAE